MECCAFAPSRDAKNSSPAIVPLVGAWRSIAASAATSIAAPGTVI
jgi:hypothetical protein